MRILLMGLLGFLLLACGQKNEQKIEKEKIFLKKGLAGLQKCLNEHAECQADHYCVQTPDSLGRTRQCIQQNQLGEYFGCTTGKLIILPSEPWGLDCLEIE